MASSVRMAPRHRRPLYALVLLSWTSGILFFVLNNWVTVEGEFGPQKHPWQQNVLQIHGAAAFLMLITFGALLASHAPAGWRVRSVRPTGLAAIIAQAVLIASAYLLLYLGDEELRRVTVYLHASVGFSLPFLLVMHLRQSLRRRRRRQRTAVDGPKARRTHPAGRASSMPDRGDVEPESLRKAS